MFAFFVSIAIFIACLGLFGLAAFAVERRTRRSVFAKYSARARAISCGSCYGNSLSRCSLPM